MEKREGNTEVRSKDADPLIVQMQRKKLRQMGGEVNPGETEKMYKNMTKAWVAEVNREHGVQLTASDVEGFPSCPRGPHGPGGPPGLRGPGGPPGLSEDFRPEFQRFDRHGEDPGFQGRSSENVSRIFGETVGRLLGLSQLASLPEEVRKVVNEGLVWFSNAISSIAEGADVAVLVVDAKEWMNRVMGLMGPGSPGFSLPPEEIGRIREEIKWMLKEMEEMIAKIPEAFALLLADYNIEVPGWRPIFADIEDAFAEGKEICERAIASDASDDFAPYEQCFRTMQKVFGEEMEEEYEEHEYGDEEECDEAERRGEKGPMRQLMCLVMDNVDPEIMEKVGKEVGLDEQGGRDDDHFGPRGGDMDFMREFMEECKERGGTKEDCMRRAEAKFGSRGSGMSGPFDFGPEGELDSERMMEFMIKCMQSESEQECKEDLFDVFAPSAEDFRGGYEDYGDYGGDYYDY